MLKNISRICLLTCRILIFQSQIVDIVMLALKIVANIKSTHVNDRIFRPVKIVFLLAQLTYIPFFQVQFLIFKEKYPVRTDRPIRNLAVFHLTFVRAVII